MPIPKTNNNVPPKRPWSRNKCYICNIEDAGKRSGSRTEADMSASTIGFTGEMLLVNLSQLVHPWRSPSNRASHHLTVAVTNLICHQVTKMMTTNNSPSDLTRRREVRKRSKHSQKIKEADEIVNY